MKKAMNCFVLVFLAFILMIGGTACMKKPNEYSTSGSMFIDKISKPVNGEDFAEKRGDEFKLIDYEWTINNIPELKSEELRRANYALEEWVLTAKNDNVFVVNAIGFHTFRFDVADGYFIGEDLGEYGGSLTFHAGEKSYELSDECNPVAMFVFENELYLLEGVSHLKINDGKIYKLETDGSQWKMTEVCTLKGAPDVILLDDNKAYVVTNTTISTIHKTQDGLSVEVLVDAEFMSVLYPSSIVKKDDILYVGMRGGIFTFNLTSKETSWLVKK